MEQKPQGDQKAALLAQRISNICIPPAFYGAATTVVVLSLHGPGPQKFLWWAILTVVPALLPMQIVYRMVNQGKLSHQHVPIRQERTIPYLISILTLVLTAGLLHLVRAPGFLLAMTLAYLGNTLFIFLINFFWKMSAHLMGASGPVGVLVYKFGLPAMPLLLLLIPLGWARLQLRAHTLAQVIAGALSGFVLVMAQLWMWMKILA
jgi:membrane-associated phospholipid phosphatase